MANATRIIKLDQAAIAAVAEFKRIKADIRRLEDLKSASEAMILASLNGREIGLDAEGNRVVVVSHRHRGGTDRKLLEVEYPEAFAATSTTTEYDVLMTP